jgi:hypothetical protein
MKIEAIKKLTGIESESVLSEVPELLNANREKEATNTLSKNYDAIKEQYGDVLQKLAQ